MAFIAGAIIGSAVLGTGASLYGANKASKENRAARDQAMQQQRMQMELDNKERARMWGLLGPDGKAITPASSQADVDWAFNNASPSTGVMPGYADQMTGVTNLEGQEFKKAYDTYLQAQKFWDAQAPARQQQMDFFNQLPAKRQEIAQKTFEAIGKIRKAELESEAKIAEAQGKSQSQMIAKALGGENARDKQNSLLTYGGVGGGGAMDNSFLSNMMSHAPAAAKAELEGIKKASALRTQAEIETNPLAAGLQARMLDQTAKDYNTADLARVGMSKALFTPQSMFLQQTQPFAAKGFGQPSRIDPVYFEPDMSSANAWQNIGNTIFQAGGQYAGAAMQNNAMKDFMAAQQGFGQGGYAPGWNAASTQAAFNRLPG